MTARVANLSAYLLAVVALASGARPWTALASSGAIDVTLEQRLHEQRPDVLRWQVRALSEATAVTADAEIAGVGKIGSRTAVRFVDGRVRWYAVAGMGQVLVSAHAVERGAALDAADAQLAERDIVALGCDAVRELDASRRWRAARRLATGDPLCARDIEVVPDVERDRPVTLNAQRGVVSASRVLTADSDAHFGERVRLRDRASGVVVVAVVTGPGAARLSEEQE
jgi:flagella basal body P-ring formation protein FlgA